MKKRILSCYLKIKRKFFGKNYSFKSYSQEGEDMILRRIFEQKSTGFYVDVGAHHPKRFSNTYYFYKLGWRGINIDAMPGSMNAFNKQRPNDINIEVPVSDKKKVLTYYMFNEPALNGFSKELSEERIKKGRFKLLCTKNLETETLEEILDRSIGNTKEIDFLTIDVEGYDYNVLKSLDLKKYQPKVIIVEALDSDFNGVVNSKISAILKSFNYIIYAKAVHSVFFMHSDYYKEIID